MGPKHAQAELVDPGLKHGSKLSLDEGALVGVAIVLSIQPNAKPTQSRLTHHLRGPCSRGVAGGGGGGLRARGHHHDSSPGGGGGRQGGAGRGEAH